MKKINYTFIIPYKNSPQYLIRCIDSIPQREDVEIIVVDDNSDEDKKPYTERKDVKIILLSKDQCNGAGRARNVGLSKASGKWILFADCDDYYVADILDKLDIYQDFDDDVIYFNFYQYLEGRKEYVWNKISNYITECSAGERNIDYVKYRNNAPWNKMVRRNFLEAYRISFEEQPIANDAFFSYQVGYFSQKVKVSDEKLYNYIVYKKSQTNSNWNKIKIKAYLEYLQKYNGFMRFVNHNDWTHGFLFLCFQLYKSKNLQRSFNVLWYYISHYNEICKSRNNYPDIIQQKVKNSIPNK